MNPTKTSGIKVVILDSAFLTLPNPRNMSTVFRCAFAGGEILKICSVIPLVDWPPKD